MLGLLNVFDLNMTIKAMDQGVMFEVNPIAQHVIENHGRAGISLFKAAVIGTSLILLAIARHYALSEIVALGGVILYIGVCVLWVQYPFEELVAAKTFYLRPQPGGIPDTMIGFSH